MDPYAPSPHGWILPTSPWTLAGQWQRLAVLSLRWRGWKCEGPFPRGKTSGMLILGPGLTRDSYEVRLVESQLKHFIHWWPSLSEVELPRESANAPMASSPPTEPTKILVEWHPERLAAALNWAHQHGWNVQLVSLSIPLRRVRCNTPFLPGKFTSRECAYVERVFSYAV